MKKFRFGAFVAIAACLMLAAVGFAAASRWGLFDFIGRYANVQVLPEATGIVATNLSQQGGETEYAAFSVREAVYDGHTVYMVFDVKPKEGVLLLGVDSEPEDSMRDLTKEESDMTIGEYAAANNLKMVRTNIGTGFSEASLDFHMERDGTLVYGIQGPAPEGGAEKLEMQAVCITYPEDTQDFDKDVRRAQLAFALDKAAELAAGEGVGTAEFPGCGVKVEAVHLHATLMGLYYEIEYTVTDKEAFGAAEDGLWFEFLNGDGERVEDGAAASSQVRQSGGGFVQSGSVAAVKEIPAAVTLRAYNAWTKDRYDTAEIAIQAK